MKRIPKAFSLGAQRITVHVVNDDEMRAACKRTGTELGDEPPRGLTHFEGNAIYVSRAGKQFPKSVQMQTFWHEYFHMLFWYAGRERLSRDETLVDNLGSLQLQMIQTAEF